MTPHVHPGQNSFLGTLPDSEVHELLRDPRTKPIEANGVVFRKDDPGDGPIA